MRALAIAFAAGACAPMYGGHPEKLHTPAPTAAPKVPVDAVAIRYVDDCQVDFHRAPRPVRPAEVHAAATLVTQANTTITSKASDDAGKLNLVVRGIAIYAEALRMDPYNAQATLELAVAYDQVLHKGCALAMLRRLESLTTNPIYAAEATHRIDDIVDNAQWFKGYRTDALAAVNH